VEDYLCSGKSLNIPYQLITVRLLVLYILIANNGAEYRCMSELKQFTNLPSETAEFHHGKYYTVHGNLH